MPEIGSHFCGCAGFIANIYQLDEYNWIDIWYMHRGYLRWLGPGLIM